MEDDSFGYPHRILYLATGTRDMIWLEGGLSNNHMLNLFVYYMGWNLLPARSREAELYIVGKPMHV